VSGSAGEPAGERGSGAAAVGAGILLSRLAGFVRASVTGALFGVGPHADVLQTALRAPNVLQNLLGEQTLSASFIPVYSRLLAQGRPDDARRFAGAVFGLLAAIAGALALAGVLLARPLVAIFAAGYLADAAKVAAGELAVDRYELAVRAVRWMFPMTALLVLSAWALGVLNSHRRFLLSYCAPVVWNGAIVAALALTAERLGALRTGLAGLDRLLLAACVGALVGGGLQFLVQLPGTLRALGGLRPALSLATPGVREALAAFGPAVAGRGVVQVASYLDQLLASLLAVGAVAALGYAQLLYLLPVSLFGLSVAAASLPDMARRGGSDDHAGLADRAARALAQSGFLNLPSTVAYLTLGWPIVEGLYRLFGGGFGRQESLLVWLVLAGYSLGLPASTGSRVLQTTFFALGDTRTPARAAGLRVAVGVALGAPLMLLFDRWAVASLPGSEGPARLRLGAVGLALAASAAAWLERAALRRGLARRLPALAWPRRELALMLAAASAAAVPGFLAWRVTAGLGLHPALIALAAGAGFAAAYGGLAVALRLPQVELIRGRWPLRRR
jgi:putative peptidoglycan lipid II flippase